MQGPLLTNSRWENSTEANTVVKTREFYGQEALEYIAILSEWESKSSICIIHALFLSGTVVMQILSTGFARGLEQFV